MGLSWSHILIVLIVFVLLFGRGKISEMMGDVAKGIKSFKKGLAEDDAPEQSPKSIGHEGADSGEMARSPAGKTKVDAS